MMRAIALGVGLVVAGAALAPRDRAIGRPPPVLQAVPAAQEVEPAVEAAVARAVERGLRFLAARQEDDGAWIDRVGRKVHMTYVGTESRHVGVTALVCMAFLANGSLPGAGHYGENVERGMRFILRATQPNGFITANESRMYSHAFATLFLAEVYGMTADPMVRGKLKDSVQLIVTAQNKEGGWRYLPGAEDSDMSVTVCQVMALRGARNAGIYVPKPTIDRAIRYVRASFCERSGGFDYQLASRVGGHSRHSFALTAAGVSALQSAGLYDCTEVRRGLEFMERSQFPIRIAPHRFDLYYGYYYAVQAAFQAGGDYWKRFWDRTRQDLLELQQEDGRWEDLVGPNYATAMATLILQIPRRYLPIFER